MQTADVPSASSKHGDRKPRAGVLAQPCSHACCMPKAPGSSVPAPALTAHPVTAPAPATQRPRPPAQPRSVPGQRPGQRCQASRARLPLRHRQQPPDLALCMYRAFPPVSGGCESLLLSCWRALGSCTPGLGLSSSRVLTWVQRGGCAPRWSTERALGSEAPGTAGVWSTALARGAPLKPGGQMLPFVRTPAWPCLPVR